MENTHETIVKDVVFEKPAPPPIRMLGNTALIELRRAIEIDSRINDSMTEAGIIKKNRDGTLQIGKVIIPDDQTGNQKNNAIIIALGDGPKVKELGLEVGQRVFIGANHGWNIPIAGKVYNAIDVQTIVGILNIPA